MAKAPTLTTVLSGYYSNTALNSNFDAIETAFENTVSLDGSTPNAMEADFDLNDNDLLNAGSVYASHLYVSGVRLTDATYVPNWEGEWATATDYVVNDTVREDGNVYICLVDHTSGTFAADLTADYWELFASKGSAGDGTGDLLSTNNLSDLTDAATARSNLDAVGTTDTQTLTNKTLTAVVLQDGLTVDTEAYSWTGSNALDPANGLVQEITMTGNVTFTDSLADGESIILHVDDGTAYSITWPTITWISGDGSAPTLQTTGDTVITVWKVGSTLYGFASNGA